MISKAIILAGGKGTRIGPSTSSISKHLIPIFDKPMIFYSLGFLIRLGIKDIIIIVNTKDKSQYQSLLGNGKFLNIKITYIVQKKPNGLPEAFKITASKIKNKNTLLILGDTFLLSRNNYFNIIKKKINNFYSGSLIFTYQVKDITKFGAIKKKGKQLIIKEKPDQNFSKKAIIGIYVFDQEVIKYSKSLKKSARGEYEITDLINVYLKKNKLKILDLKKNDLIWRDLGNAESVLNASNLVKRKYNKKSLIDGYLEYLAYREGIILKKNALASSLLSNVNFYSSKSKKLLND